MALGKIHEHTYAFIGLERMVGIVVFNVSNPHALEFNQYINDCDVLMDPEVYGAAAGDRGPAGLLFVDAEHTPIGKPLVLVANKVCGTVGMYQVDVTKLRCKGPLGRSECGSRPNRR